MNLAELVNSRRTALGMSLQDVADASDLTKGHVWEIEQGKVFDLKISTAVKLSICLNTQINVLIAAALFNREQAK